MVSGVSAGDEGILAMPTTLRLILTKRSARQKICADHLKTIAARLVSTQHQPRCFECFLNNRDLTLEELEINDFPGLSVFASKMPLDFVLESFLGHLFGSVQPGCTVKGFAFSARHFDELYCFAPSNFSQLLFWDSCQFLVNRHQVIGLTTRPRKSFFEEFVKRV